MDNVEEKELERRRLTDELRSAVESELKKRYSWIGLVVAVIMSSVMTLTVREILLPARVQMKVIDKLQERAMEQLNETSSQSEKLKKPSRPLRNLYVLYDRQPMFGLPG